MLRLSADTSNTDIDLAIVNGDDSGPSGVPYSVQLMLFAEAVAGREPAKIAAARQALYQEAGNDVVVDAAAVAGNFQRMVRIADSTGIPVDERMNAMSVDIQEKLDLRRFHSAQNTPKPPR
jgi:hypothetical protein